MKLNMKTIMHDLQLTPLAPRYQKELDRINKKNKKLIKKQERFVKNWKKRYPNEPLEDIPTHLKSDEDLGIDELLNEYSLYKKK